MKAMGSTYNDQKVLVTGICYRCMFKVARTTVLQ